jgi:hypothetical protein
VATEGGDSPTGDTPDTSAGRNAADADVVITTVVSAEDPKTEAPSPSEPPAVEHSDAGDMDWIWDDADDGADDLRPPLLARPAPEPEPEPVPEPAPPTAVAPAEPTAREDVSGLEERLAALEELPSTVEAMSKAVRHELERCAGVLFAHDKALGAVASRLDGIEAAPPAPAPSEPADDSPPVEARVLGWVEDMSRRLVAMEARVEPLEPLPTVVQALRRAVRAAEDLIVGETGAREQALAALAAQHAAEAQSRDDALRRLLAQDLDKVTGVSNAQAKGLADLAERLAAAEARLAPLDSAPEDIAALSRILRRELDAIVSDNQARDQMLRRALQNEIDQLRATSEAREALAQALTNRLEALEARSAEAAQSTAETLTTAGGRLDALEGRVEAVDRIGTELEALRAAVAEEMVALQAGGKAHDQLAGELTRRLAALEGRLARIDPLPGEVQSLRTAMLQEAERTVTALRATDERIGQLAWVPGEFQEARKRIMSLTSTVQSSQDQLRQLEAAIVSVNERLDSVRARLVASAPPQTLG